MITEKLSFGKKRLTGVDSINGLLNFDYKQASPGYKNNELTCDNAVSRVNATE